MSELLSIQRVENGFIVREQPPGHMMQVVRSWVAHTPEELAELVRTLVSVDAKKGGE